MRVKTIIAGSGIALSAIALDSAFADAVLMLNEPRDVTMAGDSCERAEEQIKAYESLIKAFECAQSEECQRAIEINAVCKAVGPAADVRAFHSKLLAQFAGNAQCAAMSIMRLTDGKSDGEVKTNLEAFRRATWELNLGFVPGATKQSWALWPYQSGNIVVGRVLEGEGDTRQIARDVCTIVTRGGAKILN